MQYDLDKTKITCRYVAKRWSLSFQSSIFLNVIISCGLIAGHSACGESIGGQTCVCWLCHSVFPQIFRRSLATLLYHPFHFHALRSPTLHFALTEPMFLRGYMCCKRNRDCFNGYRGTPQPSSEMVYASFRIQISMATVTSVMTPIIMHGHSSVRYPTAVMPCISTALCYLCQKPSSISRTVIHSSSQTMWLESKDRMDEYTATLLRKGESWSILFITARNMFYHPH